MTAFHVGDRGQTARGKPYRILVTDLRGRVGPIVAAVTIDDIEWVHQYPADGTHPGGLVYLDLVPPARQP